MLSNTYTVTKLHTSTTTEGVDALIEQLEQDKINAKSKRYKYFIRKKYLHKNSSEYKDYTIWFMMECERLRNSEKYLIILKEGNNNNAK